LLKSGYEADIKILQATIEEQRLKTQDIEATRMEDFQKIMQNNEEMVSKLKHQESFID
jgi:coenzyme F420-reducing hydrogenase delta subunit